MSTLVFKTTVKMQLKKYVLVCTISIDILFSVFRKYIISDIKIKIPDPVASYECLF